MRIVKNDAHMRVDEDTIRREVGEKLGDFIQLDVAYVDSIETLKNGKYRYIISEF